MIDKRKFSKIMYGRGRTVSYSQRKWFYIERSWKVRSESFRGSWAVYRTFDPRVPNCAHCPGHDGLREALYHAQAWHSSKGM